MHATRSRTHRGLLTRTANLTLGLCLSLGLVLALAWVGAWTAEEAASEKGVEYGGRTSAAHAKATRAVTLTKPAGTTAGDLLVASFSTGRAPKVSAVPDGWTSLLPGRLRAGRGTTMFAYFRVVTAADSRTASWSWSLSTRQTWSGGVARYVGVDRDHPLDSTVSMTSKGSTKRLEVPGVTTTRSGTMLVGSLGAAGGRFTTTPPGGWTEAWEITRGTASEHAYQSQQDVGATGALTWRVSSARALGGWMTALRPAGRKPGTTPTPTTSAPTPTPTPTTGPTTPGTPTPPVLVGAGDIATCDFTEDSATAALVNATAGTVFTLGDNAYPDGTAADYANCYQPTWGVVKDRTRPVVGNHEYLKSSTAAPYFAYFGAAAGEPGKGWYSYDIGTDWHVVVLNSNCTYVGGCGAGSVQEQWLRADLAASTRPCTIAMWHHPRFSSGEHGNDSSTDAFWKSLYADGAELVLNGHDHDYERFAPQNPSGVADPTYGIREFVVGTGGKDFRSFSSTAANSQVRSIDAHGVLRLTLSSGSYDWTFLPIPGKTLDESGSGTCHGAPS